MFCICIWFRNWSLASSALNFGIHLFLRFFMVGCKSLNTYLKWLQIVMSQNSISIYSISYQSHLGCWGRLKSKIPWCNKRKWTWATTLWTNIMKLIWERRSTTNSSQNAQHSSHLYWRSWPIIQTCFNIYGIKKCCGISISIWFCWVVSSTTPKTPSSSKPSWLQIKRFNCSQLSAKLNEKNSSYSPRPLSKNILWIIMMIIHRLASILRVWMSHRSKTWKSIWKRF